MLQSRQRLRSRHVLCYSLQDNCSIELSGLQVVLSYVEGKHDAQLPHGNFADDTQNIESGFDLNRRKCCGDRKFLARLI